MADSIVGKYFKSLPIVFPLIGLFLIVMLAFESYYYLGDHTINAVYWLRPLVMLAYTFCWIFICLKKKWAAVAFLVVAIANVSFQLFGPKDMLLRKAIGDILFVPLPINLVFAFLVLFYYRKLV